jgi:hypothetical protein
MALFLSGQGTVDVDFNSGTINYLPNSAPTPAPAPIPTSISIRPRDPKLTAEQQKMLDDVWNNTTYTEQYKKDMEGTYYSLWSKYEPTAPTPTISERTQQGMQGTILPNDPPPTGPNFLDLSGGTFLDIIPNWKSREEMMANYSLPEDFMKPERSWLDDVVDAFDPTKNGVADAFDPTKNGVADAFDPKKNGVADFFTGNSGNGEEEDEGMSSSTLLLLGAGVLVIAFVALR